MSSRFDFAGDPGLLVMIDGPSIMILLTEVSYTVLGTRAVFLTKLKVLVASSCQLFRNYSATAKEVSEFSQYIY